MSEREIFGPFPVDGAARFWDPQRVHRMLAEASRGRLARIVEDARARGPADAEGDTPEQLEDKAREREAADAVAFPAIVRLLDCAAFAFEVPAFDPATGAGLTEAELNDLLGKWFDFLAQKKTTPALTPTSPPPTGPPS